MATSVYYTAYRCRSRSAFISSQSILLTRIKSVTVSAKPTVCMATATALAKAKIRPMDPPSSGPRLRLIKK